MADLKQLVSLNVELEGLLKVLIDRDSVEARSMLADKFRKYSALLSEFLGQSEATAESSAAPAVENIVETGEALRSEAGYVEVKTQEAQEPEVVDEDDAAAAAIAHEEHRAAARHRSIASAFTLNDKYRFIREVFDGNEQDFDDTIAVVDDMDSFREAEDYIVNDLMLDPAKPDVADFLDVLAANF